MGPESRAFVAYSRMAMLCGHEADKDVAAYKRHVLWQEENDHWHLGCTDSSNAGIAALIAAEAAHTLNCGDGHQKTGEALLTLALRFLQAESRENRQDDLENGKLDSERNSQ